MKESLFALDVHESDESFDLKGALLKYLRYWPWFVVAIILFMGVGYFYLRYTPFMYESVAKIKILDDSKDLKIASDPMSLLDGTSKINMDNEIEVLKSYRILSRAVKELNLDITYYQVGNLKTAEMWEPPFLVTKTISEDSLVKSLTYKVKIGISGFTVTDEEDNTFKISLQGVKASNEKLPFDIKLQKDINIKDYEDKSFKVVISPIKETVMNLGGALNAEATNKKSEILSLSLKGQSIAKNEAILNTIIDIFNEDGILDRQLVSKRTVDFIDERFVNLSGELNSIEGTKENFKEANNLSYIEADAGMTMQKKSIAEDEAFKLETQVSLSKLLKETLTGENDYSLLPADIGLESSGINALVSNFNQTALERQKLASSAGENNPTLQGLSDQLKRGRQNIIATVNVYQQQLQLSLDQLNLQKNRAGAQFSRLPEKEKILRSIERQQSIKESLYLLLLQKREEAAINNAVTAPSIKVVDYGLSSTDPISPKKKLIFGVSMLLGLLVPFGALYMKFSLDTKIHDRTDLERVNPEIPVAAEIPYFENIKNFTETTDRSILAESFRILSTNTNYLLSKKENGEGKVIYVTSSVKEEGKTLVALNLSLAYASIKKSVLLIGADLRNPQLHTYFDIDKNSFGLSNYLDDPSLDWKKCIHKGFGFNEFHKVCFAGAIPPNAPELLSSDAFEDFINIVKKEFDYVIVDCAPTLLVTDTLLISQYADLSLFVVRADFTDKRLLDYSKNLNRTRRLNNMAYVVNDVKLDKMNGYNYGYGYGYAAKAEKKSWFKELFKKVPISKKMDKV